MALDPSRLLLLPSIREHASITRVAERTGRTPPAISQQLARLEREVGASLVERHPHGARLTPLGEKLAKHADRMAEALQNATEVADHYLHEHRNRLRLGAFPTAGLALLPDALAALRHRHPDAELSAVDLGPVEGIDLVADHQLDLALVGEYSEPIDTPPGVELIRLLDDPIHAVLPAGHPLAKSSQEQALRLVDFADDSWACAPKALPNRRQLEQAARAQGFTPEAPFETESYAVAEAVVSAGVAVAFIPKLAISRIPGALQRKLTGPTLTRRIHAVIPTSTQHTPLTGVFLKLLQDICAEIADQDQ